MAKQAALDNRYNIKIEGQIHMKKYTLGILVSAMLALGGCASMRITAPTAAQQAAADYGTLTTAQAEAAIKKELRATLLDPYSYEMHVLPDPAKKYWAVDGNGKYHYGLLTGYGVNAKNAYGGYTGVKFYLVFFERGEIVQTYEQNKSHTGYYPPENTMQ